MVLQVPTYTGAHAQITRWRLALMIDDATVDFLRAEVNRKKYPIDEWLGAQS